VIERADKDRKVAPSKRLQLVKEKGEPTTFFSGGLTEKTKNHDQVLVGNLVVGNLALHTGCACRTCLDCKTRDR
jgi:hypothetical protein